MRINGLRAVRRIAARLLPAAAQRTIRGWIANYRHSTFGKRQIRRRYGDFHPVIELVDAKGESWYDRDRSFEPEFDLLQRGRLVPGARVFDLGAHQGVVALALAHFVGTGGQVIGVEASSFDAQASERNRQLNNCENLHVIHAAVAAQPGAVEFLSNGRVAFGDDNQPTETTKALTIDDLAVEHGVPSVLFIDVDGFEVQALRGGTEVLKSYPDCYVEVHSDLLPRYGDKAEQIIDFFPQDRYELLTSHEMQPSRRVFQAFDPARHDFGRAFHLVAMAQHCQ